MITNPALSVIVCTYNGAAKIAECLSALERQEDRDRIQIIVVDDGSKDGTEAIVRKFPVEFIRHPTNRGLSAARNTGISAATAPIVAFTDDDCVPTPTWAGDLLNAWHELPMMVNALGGTVCSFSRDSFNRRYMDFQEPLAPTPLVLSDSVTFLTRVKVYLRHSRHLSAADPDQAVASLVGANMSFRTESLSSIGGFDELRKFGGDEDYVCRSLRAKYGAGTIWCQPAIVMPHVFDESVRDTFRRSYSYGIGLGRNAVSDGGIPSLQPMGLVAVAAIPLGLISVLIPAVAVFVLPPLLEFRVLKNSVISRRPERLSYPWLMLCQEVMMNAGFFVGWFTTRKARRSSP